VEKFAIIEKDKHKISEVYAVVLIVKIVINVKWQEQLLIII